MIKSLFSGITALQANTQAMGAIGDNIANVGTTGFKSSRLDFANLLSQSVGGYTGQEVGSGVSVQNLSRDWTQGSIQTTSNVTDLAINGNGFFIVTDENGHEYYTRAGTFHFDKDGYLVDNNGYKVQGDGGDLQLTDTTGTTSISISSVGVIKSFSTDSTAGTEVGTIALATFPCNWGLASMDRNLYTTTSESGDAAKGAPGSAGKGSLSSYSLESSNVDLASEFGKMITTQRSFQAAAKVITASDEVLQQLLGIKR
jgi:flagellar hook protein FlgE